MDENARNEVLELLFAAKKKLEECKEKKCLHSTGYIDEAIKWVQYDK